MTDGGTNRPGTEFKGTRIFINNVDEYVPGALCAEMRLQGDVFLSGTLRGGKRCGQIPSCVRRVLSRVSPSEMMSHILQNDVIVYDMHSCDLEELELVVSALNANSFTKPTCLVLVSSLLTWSRTVCPGPTTNDPQPMVGSTGVSKFKVGYSHIEPTSLSDADWESRIPSVRYADWKAFELLWLGLGKKSNVRAFVVGAGILYGNGEQIFQNWFRACYNRDFEKNFTIGDGSNFLPLVHCRNLARFTRYSVFQPGDARQTYYVAVDQTAATQKQILDSIRLAYEEDDPRRIRAHREATKAEEPPAEEGGDAGEGADTSREDSTAAILTEALHGSLHIEQVLLMENADILATNLKFKPSAEMFQFANWCGVGFCSSADVVAEEYRTWRGLTPLKAIVAGEPGTYQHFLPAVAEYFQIQILTIKDIVAEFLEREERDLYFRMTAHKKYLETNPPPAEEEPRFAEYEPVPTPELSEIAQKAKELQYDAANEEELPVIRTLLLQKLNSSRCRTKGYVFDSWPVGLTEATEYFSELRYIPPPPPPETRSTRSSRSSRRSQPNTSSATATENGESAAPSEADGGTSWTSAAGAAKVVPEEPQGHYERFLLPTAPDILLLFEADKGLRRTERRLYPDLYGSVGEESSGEESTTESSELLQRVKAVEAQAIELAAMDPEAEDRPEKIGSTLDFFEEHGRLHKCSLNSLFNDFADAAREELDSRKPESEGASRPATAAAEEGEKPEPTPEEAAEAERERVEAERIAELKRQRRERALFVVKKNCFLQMVAKCYENMKGGGTKFRNFLPPLDVERDGGPIANEGDETRAIGFALDEDSPKERAEKEAHHRQVQQKTEAERRYQEKLKREEESQLEEVSEPLRKYMAEYVTPHVTEALIEICRVMPEDPVDYLAEFLFFKSEELKGPDPDN
ncbi:unnamed protein product [Amoebophrya sp. A25]|nr:unnamed protein product [Amoebophrya sp. A25]|eukprot:GSA25T00015950001.1